MSDNNGHDDNDSLADTIIDDEMRARFKGATLDLNQVMAEDGRLAQASRQQARNQGVINHILSPVGDNEYRDILLRLGSNGRYYIEALAECRTYNQNGEMNDQITYIVDRMHDEVSKNPSPLLMNGLKALTHTSITATARNIGGKIKNWWNRDNDKSTTGISGNSLDF